MPLPKPRKGEEQNKFISRCVSFVKRDKPSTPQEQAVAMCFTQFRRSKKENMKEDLIAFLKKLKLHPKIKPRKKKKKPRKSFHN